MVQLRSPALIKTLKDWGVKIKVTPAQAAKLESLSPLLEISESSSIEESQNTDELKALLESQQQQKKAGDGNKTAKRIAEEDIELDEEEMEMSEDEDWETPQAKASKKRKAEDEKAAIDLLGKFVNLTDLIPPLPKKGDFKVEAIKASQYFFS